MGNVLGKPRIDGDTRVDGGRAIARAPSIRPRTQPEYDPKIVAKLIVARRLAPLYEGQAEPTNTEVSSGESEVSMEPQGEEQPPVEKQPKGLKKLFKRKKTNAQVEVPAVSEEWLRSSMVECPICYLVSKSFLYSSITRGI